MQEEVTQKTVTFCIRTTKVTADLLKKPSIHKRLATYRAMMPKKSKDKVKNRHQEQSR